MATQAELERLAGKVLLDPDFRASFRSDPAKAAASLGIELDDQQLAAAKGVGGPQLDTLIRETELAVAAESAKWGK